ncbi:uncharacterized protein LOC108914931 isoform X2 [Anoplophora glabripennis]|uniref:uncharacterized protein LOC108914931 isoform X2 n=1 Tax=Anoplophora glabripennis TaxID=217634 RepID=UPI000873959C|nr:uncharacterized protein LOC108914931 isoform X2 [Anoplophora glabripennis]
MSCILCKRTGGIFNIYTIYGNANRCVRDDIITILGADAESYLHASDCVCNVCMNMLENVSKLKWRLWRVIANENQDCKPINLGKIWELFATFKREDDREDDGVSCRTPTPNLLVLSHSRDYSPGLEEQIRIMERNRSRASSGVGRSDISESSKTNGIPSKRKRLRRKGHNWTHRKRHGPSPASSEFSYGTFPPRRRNRRQSDTPLSERSYISYYTRDKSGSLTRNFEEGRRTGTRTRSVSREQEREIRNREELEHTKFYCTEEDCPLYFEDLDVLNHHKIMDHDVLALHYCDECQQRYTTGEHLKIHKETHYIGPFWCLLCFTEIKNQEALQKHLEEHASYSVRCKYCDKSFLSKSLREDHLKTAHTEKKERILYKKDIIMDRIDKDGANRPPQKKNSGNSQYKVFISPFTGVECGGTELDVTPENMALMNVDFATWDEPSSSNGASEVVESETGTVTVEAS